MVPRREFAGTSAGRSELIPPKCGIIVMDLSVYQARWLLAPVFALSLSLAVLAALSG